VIAANQGFFAALDALQAEERPAVGQSADS
jgi:hypothetical protein